MEESWRYHVVWKMIRDLCSARLTAASISAEKKLEHEPGECGVREREREKRQTG